MDVDKLKVCINKGKKYKVQEWVEWVFVHPPIKSFGLVTCIVLNLGAPIKPRSDQNRAFEV